MIKKKNYQGNFRHNLTLLMIGFATVPLIMLAIPIAIHFFEMTKASAERELEILAESFANNIATNLKVIVKASSSLGLDSDVHRSLTSSLFLQRADVIFEDFIARNPKIKAIHLLDLGGKLVTAAPIQVYTTPPPKQLIKTSMNYLEETTTNRTKLHIGKYPEYINSISASAPHPPYLLAIMVPVVGLLNRNTGVIIIQMKVGDLIKGRPSSIPMEASPTLFWQNQIVYLQSSNSSKLPTINSSKVQIFPEINRENAHDQILSTLSVMVTEPTRVRFDPLRRRMLLLSSGTVILLIFLGGLAWLFAVYLSNPLNVLERLVRRFKAGDYTSTNTEVNFQEFQDLAKTLEEMAQNIMQNIDTIRDNERIKTELFRTQVEFQIDTLKKQMSPHFLFNALNSVATLIPIDQQRSQLMVKRLADLFRLILDASKSPTIAFKTEIAIVKAYLELEKFRYGDRLSYQINITDKVGEVLFPGLLLQTLVENAVKHGISQRRHGGQIILTVTENHPEVFQVSLVNSSATSIAPKNSQGIGLKNTIRRLDLLYGNNHQFKLNSLDEETTVSFFFGRDISH